MGLLSADTLTPLAVAVAIFLLLVDLMHRRQRWASRYPPGPMGLPGLGHLLQVDLRDPTNYFRKVRQRRCRLERTLSCRQAGRETPRAGREQAQGSGPIGGSGDTADIADGCIRRQVWGSEGHMCCVGPKSP